MKETIKIDLIICHKSLYCSWLILGELEQKKANKLLFFRPQLGRGRGIHTRGGAVGYSQPRS